MSRWGKSSTLHPSTPMKADGCRSKLSLSFSFTSATTIIHGARRSHFAGSFSDCPLEESQCISGGFSYGGQVSSSIELAPLLLTM